MNRRLSFLPPGSRVVGAAAPMPGNRSKIGAGSLKPREDAELVGRVVAERLRRAALADEVVPE